MPGCQNCGGDTQLDAMRRFAPGMLAQIQQHVHIPRNALQTIQDTTEQVLTWKTVSEPLSNRLMNVLNLWKGTPYVPGQQALKGGVDCVQLMGGILDMLYRRPSATKIPRLNPDTSLHDPRTSYKTISALRKHFPNSVVRDFTIEPGDIIVCRASHDLNAPRNMGHVLIAAIQPGSVFHAVPGSGACFGTIQATHGILRIYRPKEKDTWI